MKKHFDIFLCIILAIFAAMIVFVAGPRTIPAAADDNSRHFATLDIYVDPHSNSFAAYQCEIIPNAGHVSYVGISAGDHPAFSAKDPYYDQSAEGLGVVNSHLIIAALSTDATLPNAKTRVARIGVTYTGRTLPTFSLANSVVASPAANKMDAAVTFDLIPTPEK